ncbi:hypothetical protein GCM10023199_56230 [Actinomycetospora chibensis]
MPNAAVPDVRVPNGTVTAAVMDGRSSPVVGAGAPAPYDQGGQAPWAQPVRPMRTAGGIECRVSLAKH